MPFHFTDLAYIRAVRSCPILLAWKLLGSNISNEMALKWKLRTFLDQRTVKVVVSDVDVGESNVM